MMLDRKEQAQEQAPFPFEDIYKAADERRLVDLLWKSIDDSGIIELWARDAATKSEVEQALGNAAEAFHGRELRKVGVGDNSLCLVMAIVLEAIQQNFSKIEKHAA